MRILGNLFENNQRAASMTQRDPNFFKRRSHRQTPHYAWIGVRGRATLG